MSDTMVAVSKDDLDKLIVSVQELVVEVRAFLDALAPAAAPEPDPSAPHPGFQHWRNRQGGRT